VLEKLMMLFCESYVKKANEPRSCCGVFDGFLAMVGLMKCFGG
jgi:hypothetical protein